MQAARTSTLCRMQNGEMPREEAMHGAKLEVQLRSMADLSEKLIPSGHMADRKPPSTIESLQTTNYREAVLASRTERWDPLSEMNAGKDPATLCWQLAQFLIHDLQSGPKVTMRAICLYNFENRLQLTMNKLNNIMVTARTFAGIDATYTLWETERWRSERDSRPGMRKCLEEVTKSLVQHITLGGWKITTEKEKLSLQKLQNWEEGRKRCGHSYWWMKYVSPGLEDLNIPAFHQTSISCGNPACPECSLYETQSELVRYNFESAYGTEFPVVVKFHPGKNLDDSLPGPLDVKRHLSKFSKRKAILGTLKAVFGAFVPTPTGYTLQALVRPSSLAELGAVQELHSIWSEYYPNGYVEILTQPDDADKPAIEAAIDLVLLSEREIFQLCHSGAVSLADTWRSLMSWLGDKPGQKGMNRVWHSPGFREYRILTAEEETADLLDKLSPEIQPNTEDPELGGNSGEEEEKPEVDFPKTWFSLESGVIRGHKIRVFDPYDQILVYVDVSKVSIATIPEEYVIITDPKLFKSNLPALQVAEIQNAKDKKEKEKKHEENERRSALAAAQCALAGQALDGIQGLEPSLTPGSIGSRSGSGSPQLPANASTPDLGPLGSVHPGWGVAKSSSVSESTTTNGGSTEVYQPTKYKPLGEVKAVPRPPKADPWQTVNPRTGKGMEAVRTAADYYLRAGRPSEYYQNKQKSKMETFKGLDQLDTETLKTIGEMV